MPAAQRHNPHRIHPSRRRRRPVVAVFLAVVVVLAGVGVLAYELRSYLPGQTPAGSSSTDTAANSSADPIASGEALQVEESPSPVATGPRTTFADGVWVVGKDVKAGQYKTTVPKDVFACHWERMRDTAGTSQSMLDEGLGKPGTRVTVTIKSTDKAFKSELCGTWTPA